MSTITLYAFEDADGAPDTFTTDNAYEARQRGQRYQLRVIAHEYEWSDSGIAWDFTTQAPHDCGMCDGPLIHDGTVDGWDTYRCRRCGHWHISKDCCEPAGRTS